MAVAGFASSGLGGFSGNSTYTSPWLDDPNRAYLVKNKKNKNVSLQRHVSLPPSKIQRPRVVSRPFQHGSFRLSHRNHSGGTREMLEMIKDPLEMVHKLHDLDYRRPSAPPCVSNGAGPDGGTTPTEGSPKGSWKRNSLRLPLHGKQKPTEQASNGTATGPTMGSTGGVDCSAEDLAGSAVDLADYAGLSIPCHGSNCSLTSRRELVERLESEPIFDYLVQNGVMECSEVDLLRDEPSAAKKNLTVLRHVETKDEAVYGLFINALRQTGQHHLANLLDGSARIKALSGSGYLSKTRHKGQITLHIEVKALKLHEMKMGIDKIPASFLNREWLSLDDIRMRINELTERQHQQEKQTLDVQDISLDDNRKSSSCLCHCFTRMFSSRKKSSEQNSKYINSPTNSKPGVEFTNGFSTNGKSSDSQSTLYSSNNKLRSISGSKHSLGSLRCIAELLQSKADMIYAHLRDSSTNSHAQLLRYFEQERGVLVLDTVNEQHGLIVVNICTKREQLERIRRDHASGKLNRDVEACISNGDGGDLLDSVGAKAVKLHTTLDRDQLQIAEQELS